MSLLGTRRSPSRASYGRGRFRPRLSALWRCGAASPKRSFVTRSNFILAQTSATRDEAAVRSQPLNVRFSRRAMPSRMSHPLDCLGLARPKGEDASTVFLADHREAHGAEPRYQFGRVGPAVGPQFRPQARGQGGVVPSRRAQEGVCSGSVQNDTLSPQYTLAVVS